MKNPPWLCSAAGFLISPCLPLKIISYIISACYKHKNNRVALHLRWFMLGGHFLDTSGGW